MKQWSFSCTRPDRTFKEIIKALHKATLCLEEDVAAEHPEILNKGYVPLRHYLRKGDKTVSWYHSPLLPWRNTERLYELGYVDEGKTHIVPDDSVEESEPSHSACRHGGWMFKGEHQYWVEHVGDTIREFTVTPCFGKTPRVSDQLLRLDQASGIFDTTYAAAWKLGRLMALEDKRFSVALTNWKRSCTQLTHQATQACCDLHLHCAEHPDLVAAIAPPPPEVSTWFDQRNFLKGVPFNYLVPDSRMLPEESIRFFEADPLWIDCLLDGAFSLGRVTMADTQQDFQHIIADNRYPRMSGLLIRSEAVSGWPGMLVDAFYRLPDDVGVFGSVDDDKLRKALEAVGLPLPREFSVKLSDDQASCVLIDLDTNPDYVDTVLEEGAEQPPQLCLMMPDRDRQYHYTFINEGTPAAPQIYLKLPLLRQERLSNGVLLCLFQGAIQRVDVHLKPETLHFGLTRKNLSKELKDESGEEIEIELRSSEMADFWKTVESEPVGGRTLNIEKIATKIVDMTPLTEITSARFALQMIEGNELVRFTVG